MKTIKFLAVCLMAAALSACEKQNPVQADPDSVSTNPSSDVQYAQASGGVKTECTGEVCTDGTQGCWMNWDVNTNILTCCEGCSMVITTGIASNLDQGLTEYIGETEPHFAEYVQVNYGQDLISVNSIEVVNYESEFLLVKYEYTNIAQGFESSVAYRLDLDQAAAVANKFEIDCSGGCTNQEASCSESFNLNTGDVSCTCEGSCNMVVTQLATASE